MFTVKFLNTGLQLASNWKKTRLPDPCAVGAVGVVGMVLWIDRPGCFFTMLALDASAKSAAVSSASTSDFFSLSDAPQ